LEAPPSAVCRLDVGEAVELGDVAGVELEDVVGVEVEDGDDEDELLHPATSAARASAEQAVIICLSFTVLLPFRIELSASKARVIQDVDDWGSSVP
jgi:hypothetical protein